MPKDSKNPAKLREGYSTGACTAAVCAAAWRRGAGEKLSEIAVLFPDGLTRLLPLLDTAKGAALIKDGGDDPDCTHGARIYASIRPCAESEAQPEDYLLQVGEGRVILCAVEGIGLCTRPGLDCEPGKWAINVTPRRMIAENLRLAGLDAGCWLAEVGVKDGAALATRTLNARLGVLGGISILGTSGLVRPYSHEAYLASIRLCLASLGREGQRDAVFCTGGRTRAGAMRQMPALPESAFVSIGDFIADSLDLACAEGLRSVALACMPGKLCKYAAGFENTHAHRAEQDMVLLRREAAALLALRPLEGRGPEAHEVEGHEAVTEALTTAVSVREALLMLPEGARQPLLRRLAGLALERLAREGLELRLLLFDFTGHFILELA